jgi:hypothetical protein
LLWFFGFDVQAGLVQRIALGDVDDFVEGQDLQADEGRTCAIRVCSVEPAAGIQGFQFGEGERVVAGCGMPKRVASAVGLGSLAACAWPKPSSMLSSRALLVKVTGMVEVLSR